MSYLSELYICKGWCPQFVYVYPYLVVCSCLHTLICTNKYLIFRWLKFIFVLVINFDPSSFNFIYFGNSSFQLLSLSSLLWVHLRTHSLTMFFAKMKFWASFPKRDFWRQNFLQTMLFSSYQTQNLDFCIFRMCFLPF